MRWCKNAFRIPFGWFLLHLLWNVGATIQWKGHITKNYFYTLDHFWAKFNTTNIQWIKCMLHHMGRCKSAFRIPFGWFLLHLLWNIGATIQCKGQINQEIFPYPCPFFGDFWLNFPHPIYTVENPHAMVQECI